MLLRQELKGRQRPGFTLMEMLIVVAIIVALASVGGYFLMGMLPQSQQDTAFLQTKVLTGACTAYATKHGGAYPEQLDDLLKKDEAGNGPYLESMDALLDPWSTTGQPRRYQYDKSGPNNQGMKPDIWTTDPKNNTKIGNWPKSSNIK